MKQHMPRRKPIDADAMAGELAADMLSYMSSLYHGADDDQKLEIIVRYAPIMSDLLKALARASCSRRRGGYNAGGAGEEPSLGDW